MSERVHCDQHGECEATVVCVHILDTLADGVQRGFLWSLGEDDEYQAVCSDCRAMPRELWENEASKVIRVLCFDCYAEAAALNGVSVGKREREYDA